MAEASFLGNFFGRKEVADPATTEPYQHLLAPRDGYVFVVSYGQSGDVLVQDILNTGTDVVVRGENGNMLSSLAKAWHFAERDVLAAFAGHELGAAQKFEDLTILGWHLADGFVRNALSLPKGTRMAGFREIRFHGNAVAFRQQLDFMAAFFPKARFLFNTRDVAKVAQTGWWRDQDAARIEEMLSGADALFERYMSLHPDRCLHLRYEDYTSDIGELLGMFDWLGLPAPDTDSMAALVKTHRAALKAGVDA